MSFAGKVWRLLVGIKDALALLFLLLFFLMLFTVLSSRPNPGVVRDGALLLHLQGSVVEEVTAPDPLEVLISGTLPAREYAVRDLIRAIDGAVADDRIKAVVLDLTTFTGGGQVHMEALGEALDRVRQADKPVLTYAVAYEDDSLMLAAHATEVWVHPMGGATILGPGGTRLYYAGLLDKFNVNAKVYRVGTYKSAVEPYLLNGMSPEARENAEAYVATLWEEWQANVKTARPQVDIEKVTQDIDGWLSESGGDIAQAAVAAGLVDKLGDRVAFGTRVAEIVGEDSWAKEPGAFAHTELSPWLASLSQDRSGKAIAVVTIAGEITDGKQGPGVAGGERIAGLLNDAYSNDNIAALVVRVDSPGGSVLGSEEIRQAILRFKEKGIPIAVSMANYAASGGYWVSTPADRIFAEPETITGSIGVFGVLPTFEDALADYGVTSDGVQTTPLSGQPDILGGFTPEVDTVLQKTVESIYDKFLTISAESRGKTTDQIHEIAQGRVWDGGTARQLGLVDQFGGIDEALEWAAKEAGLEKGNWHAQYLGSRLDPYQSLLQSLIASDDSEAPRAGGDMFALFSARQQASLMQVQSDLERLMQTSGVQAYCMECPVAHAAPARKADRGTLSFLSRLLLD